MAGGVNALARLQGKVDANGALVVALEGGSVVTGTGAATRVAFWDSASTITSDADFTFASDVLTVPTLVVGPSEATVIVSPALGVYKAGDAWIVSRNTTNNIEGFFGAYSSGVFFGSATNTIMYIGVNNDAKWGVQTAGHLTAVADNTYDIGAVGATRPRNGYFGGTLSFGTHSALAAETVSGYITVTDSAGNSRKLAVVS